VIEVPFGYSRRDQLLQFMESKFPGAEILLAHTEVEKPEVSEAFVEHDSTVHRAKAEPTGQNQDATTIMQEATEALFIFLRDAQ
jgi:hypothetical protein